MNDNHFHHLHHFARQPIVDRRRQAVACEVLFRADEQATEAAVVDGMAATRCVLAGLAAHRQELRSFVNLPRRMLVERTLLGLDPVRVAAEVLEDVADDSEVLAALTDLRAAGFTVALDDFRPTSGRMGLLDHADIVKLDVRQLGLAGLTRAAGLITGRNVALLAEKVETEAEFRFCLDLGFDMFQGFLFGLPDVVALPAGGAGWARRMRRRILSPPSGGGGWVSARSVAGPFRP